MDIELAAQTVALIAGSPARSVERQIAAGADGRILAGFGRASAAGRLQAALASARGARLLTDGVLDLARPWAKVARAFILRETGAADAEGAGGCPGGRRRWKRPRPR